MIEKFTENETSEKSRRSLVALALATLLIANVEIVSDRMSVLGLEFLISQERLIALGQISTFAALIFFLLRSSGEIVEELKKARLSRLERHKSDEFRNLSSSWGFDAGDPPDFSPEGEFKELEYSFALRKKEVESYYQVLVFIFQALQVVILNYGFPIFVSVLAIFHPQALSDAVGYISGTEASRP